MKVWVEMVNITGIYNQHVFSSKENVTQYWTDLGLADSPDKVVDSGNRLSVDKPEWLCHREAVLTEVDEYYAAKARKEAEERRMEEERKEREIPDEPLGPCPKCGGEAVVNHPAYDGGAYVSCQKCHYSPQRLTWAPTDRRAIYNWNRLTKESEE